jgi:hypothetical protein
LQDLRRIRSFSGPVFRRTSCAQFATSEVENPRAMTTFRHLEQCAAAGLFHVIAVRGNGKYVNP